MYSSTLLGDSEVVGFHGCFKTDFSKLHQAVQTTDEKLKPKISEKTILTNLDF